MLCLGGKHTYAIHLKERKKIAQCDNLQNLNTIQERCLPPASTIQPSLISNNRQCYLNSPANAYPSLTITIVPIHNPVYITTGNFNVISEIEVLLLLGNTNRENSFSEVEPIPLKLLFEIEGAFGKGDHLEKVL